MANEFAAIHGLWHSGFGFRRGPVDEFSKIIYFLQRVTIGFGAEIYEHLEIHGKHLSAEIKASDFVTLALLFILNNIEYKY